MHEDKSFTIEELLLLWGKTDKADGSNYHPLLFHLIDVSLVALEMWTKLPRQVRTRLACAIGVRDEANAGCFIALLAGLHDLGKACPNFQQKAPQFLAALKALGLDFPAYTNPHPHNFVSVPETIRLFQGARGISVATDSESARVLSYVLGAHHGVFPTVTDVSQKRITSNVLGTAALWEEMRDELARYLVDALPKKFTRRRIVATVQNDRAITPLLAAFISVADWFGSSYHFPIRGAWTGAKAYSVNSRRCARAALRKSGWTAPSLAPISTEFSSLFAYLNPNGVVQPNALQRSINGALRDACGPSLWIIEEEMGAGKTEAAFTILNQTHLRGDAHGLYVAMPTQATSNAMYDRLKDFLHKGRGERDLNLILAHSHAALDADYRKRIVYADRFRTQVYDETQERDDNDEGVLRIRAWFTAHKQTLLAHYGVGTIDQALMGVLQTRHWFVRLFGLAGKVVIFDEVHAYDAYMNTLLQLLLTWLAELNCTVVLLSATLPDCTRMELADAYRKRAGLELSAPGKRRRYPRITIVPKSTELPVNVRRVGKTKKEVKDSRKVVRLEQIPNNAETVKKSIVSAIPGDGCAIVVCNTVKGAQSMYRELSGLLEPDGWHCILFHARTPFRWRKVTEEDVLERFGKTSGERGTKPRPKTLLVATQVVEQSLDLDADFVASELAPIDLLLQRMGRLWRHRRNRTALSARFAILYDVDGEGLPDLGKWKTVYAEHTLMCSWLEIRGRNQVHLPDDIEPMVKSVYDNPDPTNVPPELKVKLRDAGDRLRARDRERARNASGVSVYPQESGDNFLDWIDKMHPTLADDDDPETHRTLRALTRDGDPSITVVCCGTDNEGCPLAPDPDGEISSLQAAEMLQFCLSLSHRGLYEALKVPTSENSPANWRQAGHLKYARRLKFTQGECVVGKFELGLSRRSGLEET